MAQDASKDEVKKAKQQAEEVFSSPRLKKAGAESKGERGTGADEWADAPAGAGDAADGLSGSAASKEQDDLNRD